MRFDIDEIFERYKDHIFAIGFNYFKNSIDADDVVQEVFYKLYKSNKDFESEDHLRNWLIRVAINECKRVTLSSWFKKERTFGGLRQDTGLERSGGERSIFGSDEPAKKIQDCHPSILL